MSNLSLVGSSWVLSDSCPPIEGSWVEKARLDLKGLDSQSFSVTTAPSSTVVTKGGVPYADIYHDYSGTGLVYDINASSAGIRADWISGASNYLTMGVSLNAMLGIGTFTANHWRGLVCVQMLVENITYAGANSERFSFGVVGDYSNSIGNGTFNGSTIMDDGLGGTSVGYYAGSDVNEYTAQPATSAACFSSLIMNGNFVDLMVDYQATPAYTTPYTESYGPMLAYRTPTKGQPYFVSYSNCYLVAVSRRKTNATVIGFRVMRFQ